MQTAAFNPALLRTSVFAVPPLARDANGIVCPDENEKIIRYLEQGGVRSILYGGNAVFYHMRLSEYDEVLRMLAQRSGDETVIVPSIGPAYGVAADQVDVLRDHDFGTVMLLPSRDVVDQAGIASGVRQLAEQLGKPIVLYLKFDRWLKPSLIKALEDDGAISWIKYAVVRDDPADDDYLREVLEVFPAERVVSGIGEQPAIVHLNDFGVTGFTSGCVCVAPKRSMEMMHAIHAGDLETAESIRKWFLPLEDLRNGINPIRVLHHAVAEAGIAHTGDLLPMLSNLSADEIAQIAKAVSAMMVDEKNATSV
ncbi:dihydrodipicolinate synthase family protein [Stieleria varia]|uniref:5-dehydro-4-deoxyglucarate dehydratase n=1 Tax=Stieleria varia TaxID=2528005 RepID=A0A5C6AGV4_9BACT|nr:dihydrodipicolinate synthase family protein [Stieleria varia]TWT98415.1 5-dehydro-4-deoxyglucarate dehydratase [Stieleria varia]